MNEIAQETPLSGVSPDTPGVKERLRAYFSGRFDVGDAQRALIAMAAGALLVTLTNALAIALVVPWPSAGARVRVLHHAFDALQTLGLGLVWGAVLSAGVRWLPFRRGVLAALYVLLSTLIMWAVLGIDLRRQAFVVWNGRFEHPLYELYIVLTGLALPAAHAIGAYLSSFRRLRFVPIGAAMAGVVVNHAVLRDDYPGVHGAITLAEATLFGAAVAPLLHGRISAIGRSKVRAWLAAPAAVLAAMSVLIQPSNAVRLELFREPGSVAAWLLARVLWRVPDLPVPPSFAMPFAEEWLRKRDDLPPVPPTEPRLFSRPPVVVFITVDAFRADVLDNPAYERFLPKLTQLKRSGVYFARTTSPGSQTSVSLTAAFSGRYFSQLFWRLYGKGTSRFDYPAGDQTPRFPELLRSSGVHTTSICSLNFLTGDYGVIRGFENERMVAVGRTHAAGKPVIDALLEQLNRTASGDSAFLFAHLTEPHAPYDRGSPQTISQLAGAEKPSDFHRYVAEISVADAEIGRVMHVLSQRFPDRAVLIVSSDHGEAFGEHGTFHHTKTLYEELLRVPLIIQGARVAQRRVDEHVGLIDIGPTILDLFGLAVPPAFMGQSLLPFLQGKNPPLGRPLLAEGRLRRALYHGHLKVIEDLRRKVIEAYDLERDPQELNNLMDNPSDQIAIQLQWLRMFYNANEARAPGYGTPYKP